MLITISSVCCSEHRPDRTWGWSDPPFSPAGGSVPSPRLHRCFWVGSGRRFGDIPRAPKNIRSGSPGIRLAFCGYGDAITRPKVGGGGRGTPAAPRGALGTPNLARAAVPRPCALPGQGLAAGPGAAGHLAFQGESRDWRRPTAAPSRRAVPGPRGGTKGRAFALLKPNERPYRVPEAGSRRPGGDGRHVAAPPPGGGWGVGVSAERPLSPAPSWGGAGEGGSAPPRGGWRAEARGRHAVTCGAALSVAGSGRRHDERPPAAARPAPRSPGRRRRRPPPAHRRAAARLRQGALRGDAAEGEGPAPPLRPGTGGEGGGGGGRPSSAPCGRRRLRGGCGPFLRPHRPTEERAAAAASAGTGAGGEAACPPSLAGSGALGRTAASHLPPVTGGSASWRRLGGRRPLDRRVQPWTSRCRVHR